MATGVGLFAVAGAASAGAASAVVVCWFDGLSARASLGVIRAFSTFALPHMGHVTRPRFACLSKATEFVNQLSNSCRLSQTRVYRIISTHLHDMELRRLRHRVNNFEAPAVLERRDASPRGSNRRRVNVGDHDGGINAALSEHAAPRVDDERVPKRVAAVLVAAALRCGEDKAAVFDRACAVQHMPMSLAGLLGER